MKRLILLYFLIYSINVTAIGYHHSFLDVGAAFQEDQESITRVSWNITFNNGDFEEKKELDFNDKLIYGFGIVGYEDDRAYYGQIGYAFNGLDDGWGINRNSVALSIGGTRNGGFYTGVSYTWQASVVYLNVGADLVRIDGKNDFRTHASIGLDTLFLLIIFAEAYATKPVY